MKAKLQIKYLLVFCMGFFGLLSQTLLFRIFLTVFDGNELSIGLFFFSWLIWVSIGAWIASRKKVLILSSFFHLLIILYIPLYLIQNALFLNAYSILGNYSFEVISLKYLIPFILLCNVPISFASGALFVLGTQWLKNSKAPVIRIYICESLGSFCGALIVTILLYLGITDETVFILASLVLLIASEIYLLTHIRYKLNKIFNFIVPCIILLVLYVLIGRNLSFIQHYVNRIEWSNYLKGGKYSGTFYTPQAKYHYGNYKGEFVVSAWNSLYESLPNTEVSSQLAAEYLSQNPKAENILIIGPGTYSLCEAFSKLPRINKITWLDTDPNYPQRLLQILPEKYLIEKSKLNIPKIDIRSFLQASDNNFDIIVLNLPSPNNLLLNRYFTYEFFLQLRKNLSDDGIAGISFPAEANYLGPELSFTGSSLMFTLELVFKDIVLKPGKDSCFFVADKKGIVSDNISKLIQRLKGVDGIGKIFNPELIASLFEKSRIEFQLSKYKEIINKYPHKFIINTDRNPKSFLYTLLFTIKKLGNIGFNENSLFLVLQKVFPLAILLILIYLFLRIIYYYLYYSKKDNTKELSKPELYFSVFAAALSSLGVNLLLIFLFQIYIGTVFLYFGIITALFMLGLFISGICTETLTKQFSTRTLFITVSIFFILILVLIYLNPPQYSAIYFSFLFFLSGLLCGPYFVLAAHSLRAQNVDKAQTSSKLEFFDNLGGAAGSIICSLILLPVIGINQTLIVLSVVISAIIVHSILLRGRKPRKPNNQFLTLRIPGYITFAIILFLLINFHFNTKNITKAASPKPNKAKWSLNKDQKRELGINNERLVPLQHKFDSTSCTYYAIKRDNKIVGYVFRTKDYTKDIQGYAGPIQMLSYINPDGQILNFTILETNETPAYLEHVLNSKNSFLKQNVTNTASEYHITTVTGATITSTALSKTLFTAGNKFISKIKNKPSEDKYLDKSVMKHNIDLLLIILIILFSILAIILRIFNNRIIRFVFICSTVIILGFLFNIQYSIINVISLLSFKIDITNFNVFVYLTIGIPLLIIFFGNFYCGYICPFGALQEIIHTISKKLFINTKTKPINHKIWSFVSSFKYIFLFAIIFYFIFNQKIIPIENTDILTFIFSFIYTTRAKLLIIGILIISIFYKRFWCRVLCPSGAFLSIFNTLKLFIKQDKRIAPGRCDIGIQNIKAIDCICCDNCKAKVQIKEQSHSKASKSKNYLFIFLSCLCLVYVLIQVLIVGLPLQSNKLSIIETRKTNTVEQKTVPVKKETIKENKKNTIIKPMGSPKNINLERYKKYIKDGYLSSREADYYRKID